MLKSIPLLFDSPFSQTARLSLYQKTGLLLDIKVRILMKKNDTFDLLNRIWTGKKNRFTGKKTRYH